MKRWQAMRVRYVIQTLLLLSVWCLMHWPEGAEWYARHVYPLLSCGLSFFSSLFPFPVGDVFIYGSVLGLLLYAGFVLVRCRGVKWMLRREIVYLAWVYVWFYLAWGLNYYRADFYERAGVQRQSYSEADFKKFLAAYTDSLNAAYCPAMELPAETVEDDLKAIYRDAVAPKYGLAVPPGHLRAKWMLVSPLMSAVGVSGYIGPFFSEYNLNRDLLPVQFPSTCAHEMAHVLGVANEAEANFYSYRACTRSAHREIRFSGYFSLLPYVLSNARRVLPKEEYAVWVDGLRPEIIELRKRQAAHWQALYSPVAGAFQDAVYNLYLKGNRISSGTANYSEVIALVMAEEAAADNG